MNKTVITYHEVLDSQEFASQMQILAHKYPDVLVTIDDGYRSVLENALPILQKHHIKSIAFINPGLLGQGKRMNADEIKKLAEGGVLIGNHTWSHKPLAHLPPAEVKEEYEEARNWIRKNISVNAAPDLFALPKGSECEHTRPQLGALGAKQVYGSERIDVYPGRSIRYFKWSINPVFQWLRRSRALLFFRR